MNCGATSSGRSHHHPAIDARVILIPQPREKDLAKAN